MRGRIRATLTGPLPMVSPAWDGVGVVGPERGPSCDPGLKLGLEQADKAMAPPATPAKTAARRKNARKWKLAGKLKLHEVGNFISALLLDLNRRR